MGEKIHVYRAESGRPEGRRHHVENPGIDRIVIQKWILKKDGRVWTRLNWLSTRINECLMVEHKWTIFSGV